MSQDGFVSIDLGGRTRDFRLGMAQISELQQACTQLADGTDILICTGALPQIIYRLRNQQYFDCDVDHPIRLGLIGAGMERHAATTLVEKYVAPNRQEFVTLAMLIISYALSYKFAVAEGRHYTFDDDGDIVKKKEPAATSGTDGLTSTISQNQPLS